jgi:hypothetical protein
MSEQSNKDHVEVPLQDLKKWSAGLEPIASTARVLLGRQKEIAEDLRMILLMAECVLDGINHHIGVDAAAVSDRENLVILLCKDYLTRRNAL